MNFQDKKRLANCYASALYECAQKQKKLYIVQEQLEILQGIIENEPDLMTIFESPLSNFEQRQLFVDQIARDFDPVMTAFLGVLNTRMRLWLIPEITEAFISEDDERNNRLKVTLTTADQVDKYILEDIEGILQQYLEKELIITHEIDAGIISGFVIRAGDLLIDGSARIKLTNLTNNLMRHGRDEIQSGRDFISN